MRRLESVRRACETQRSDDRVCRYGRHAACRYERREGDLAGYDGAQQNGRKDEHDRHCVSRLSVVIDASDPA